MTMSVLACLKKRPVVVKGRDAESSNQSCPGCRKEAAPGSKKHCGFEHDPFCHF